MVEKNDIVKVMVVGKGRVQGKVVDIIKNAKMNEASPYGEFYSI